MFRSAYLLLFLFALGLVGCDSIAVEPLPVAPPPAESADIDLGVVSVDFEPALKGNRLPVSETYAVLVAVENRGVLTARNVKVSANVTSTESGARVLQGSRSLSELAPGAIKVVRIETSGSVPPQIATYELIVQAQPLPGETILSNNTRGFTIRVAP
jgi:hypothetical protein